MKKESLVLIFLFSLFTTVNAQIITPPATSYGEGSWWCFRKIIDLTEDPEESILHIAADSKYWLWINGELQIREGGLKRGPNPQDTYKDVIYNLGGLKKGKNTIAVLVWHFGKDGFSHRNSETAGLYFDLQIGNISFNADESWRATQHPAFFVPEGEKPNYRLPESNIGYDATKEIDFTKQSFNDKKWSAPKIKTLEEADWNKLIKRPIPQWKDFGLKSYIKTEIIDDSLLLAYLPYNAQITPYIKLKSNEGKEIDIRTDNYQGGGTPNVYAIYRTKNGVQEFETYGWMNGHYVIYKIPKGVEVLDVKYRETGYNTEFIGDFKCNNPFLNKLWEKSKRTLYITMRDTYMDCPDRERAQWWGDVVNELGEAFYVLDENAHLLTRKAILELMNCQRADSTIYSPVPAGNWNQELPMQMLASVGYYGFWTYYMGTGDKQTIKEVYPNVKKYIHIWKLDSDGLVIPRKGDWTWGDWGENKNMKLLYNLWYSIALDGYAKMSRLCGDLYEEKWATETSEKLKQTFHEKFWNGEFYISPDYKGEPDDRSQALAIVSNTLPKKHYAKIRPFFQKQFHASPYMEKYVLQALCQMGYYDDALDRMQYRYKKMVESDLTTLWEGWGIGSEGYGGGSYNHAWSGGPLTIMSQYFAGISTIEPAFKSFEVKPNLGYLSNIEAIVPTQWGNIELAINDDKKRQITYNLKVPNETEAQFVVPLNFKECWVNELKLTNNQMLKYLDKANNNYRIKLEAGTWCIKIKY